MSAISSAQPPVALITGGARRVGRRIALRLAESGFDVAFTYLTSDEDASSLLTAIRAKGRAGLKIKADLCQPREATDIIETQFTAGFNRLDLLVNNASVYEPDETADKTSEQYQRHFAVHVEAPLLLARRFSARLQSAEGCIINMLDVMAERPRPGYLAYCASKAALWNLTLGLARELAPRVRVNGVAPGVVQWPDSFPQEQREKYLRNVPLKRAGTPEEAAAAVEFLARRGTYITGQVIRIDGGRSAV